MFVYFVKCVFKKIPAYSIGLFGQELVVKTCLVHFMKLVVNG